MAYGLREPVGVAVDQAGTIFVSERDSGKIIRLTPDGQRTVLAAGFDDPTGLAVDHQGRLLIVETKRGRLWRLEPTSRTLLASRITNPRWIAVGEDGTIFLSAEGLQRGRTDRSHGWDDDDDDDDDHENNAHDVILRLTTNGVLAPFAAGFKDLQGIAVKGAAVHAVAARLSGQSKHHGNVLVRIAIQPDGGAGPVEVLARGGAARPKGLALDRLGAAFYAAERRRDEDHHGAEGIVASWREGSPVSTFATHLNAPRGLAFEASGNLLVALGDDDDGRLVRFRAPAPPEATAPPFANQSSVSVSGHAEPGSLVAAFGDDDPATVLASTVAQTPGGEFTLEISLVSNTQNLLVLTATGAGGAGLIGAPAELAIVHDDVLPSVTMLQPQGGAFVRQNVPLQARATDGGSGVASLTFSVDTNSVGTLANPDPAQPFMAGVDFDSRTVADGSHTVAATATDLAGNLATTGLTVIVDNTPPDTEISSGPAGVIGGTTTTVTFTGSDALTPTTNVVFAWRLDGGTYSPFSPTTTVTLTALTLGLHTFEVKARDLAGNEDPTPAIASFRVNAAPTVALSATPLGGNAPVSVTLTATASDPDGDAFTLAWDFGDGAITSGGATQTHVYQAAGSYTATVTIADGQATAQASATIVVQAPTDGSPPDPSAVASPIDGTVATNLMDATAFLYSGANPIQTGVAPGTIEARRAAVVRGKVTSRDGAPLSAVRITVLSHPELGQTLSRADGMFDMAVNGGGLLTVTYAKAGYLSAQRQVRAPWQDYAWLPDVVLIPLDAQVNPIDLAAQAPMQIARGNVVTDADGVRQATVLFAQGTAATMVFPDGTTQPIANLSVRATEYTVGLNGPAAMPAELPPTSGYTYAVELSVDEARAAGAIDVRFSSPVPFYVENFLGFPVGIDVPLGSYDPTRGVWLAADSGRVIKVLTVTNGLADLDINGDGLADGPGALAALSITATERQQLAGLYQPGQSLWRALIPHFSIWDLNWGISPPNDAVTPSESSSEVPKDDAPQDSPTCEAGSIIECENQILGETVGVVGTRFGLQYQSERVPGRKVAYQMDIPLSGAQVPASLRQIELEIQVAGQQFRQRFLPAPNRRTSFTWDGKDAYGRTVQGSQLITVRIGYTYGGAYERSARFGASGVGGSGGGSGGGGAILITGSRARQELTLWTTFLGNVGTWNGQGNGLGGWSLSAHHAYDAVGQILYRGDGGRHSSKAIGWTISTFAGPGFSGIGDSDCYDGDGGPAVGRRVCPMGLAVGPDGSVYIADEKANRVRRVAPNGIITTVAGSGNSCFPSTLPCGDGGLATQAPIASPSSVAIGPDNSLYILSAHRVRKVGPNGIITTFAGNGVAGFSGDGGPATLARLSTSQGVPQSVAVGPDNSVYVLDLNNRRIRQVGPDGIITTFAGTGNSGVGGDGGPATAAQFISPRGIATGRDGSVYITDITANRVRRITPDGIIKTIAGTGAFGFSGDGGPATSAQFSSPFAVAVDADDTLYITDQNNNRIRMVRPDGIISTLAGTGAGGRSGDGGFALQATLSARALAVGPDGSVYVTQVGTGDTDTRVRRIASVVGRRFGAAQIIVPAADGSEIYLFAVDGRHLATLDGLTGALRYQFGYAASRLATITDGSGNVTTIERDSAGAPTAVVGPFGSRTALTLNGDGYLSRISNPAGEAVQLTYTSDGLLTSLRNPRGDVSIYAHDALGRLTSATDPTGAIKTLSRTGTNKDYTVTLTSALGRATTHRTEFLSTGNVRRTTTDPAGAQIQAVIGQDGRRTTTYPDGTVVSVVLGPDPRWEMRAPVATSVTVTTGGKVHTTTTQRTATFANASDPLSLRTLTETVTINGRAFTTAYDATTRTLTHTSPTGRRTSAVVDDRGRPVQQQFGDLAPTSYAYDARGRLAMVSQGEGAGGRINGFSYGTDGFLASFTDPLGLTTAFITDAGGRLTEQALPDSQVIRFAYDPNGNVSAITPPGRTPHTFSYTEVDQVSADTAPTVGAESSQIRYVYGADRQPVRIDRPDGQSVGFQYDSGGRLSTVDLASGQLSYGYDAAGRLASLSTTDGPSLTFAYDGRLATGVTWSGGVAGSVSRTYDNSFRVTGHTVNGSNPIAIQYDAGSTLIRAGDLNLTRSAQSGLITATILGSIGDATSYDAFGARATYIASYAGGAVYSATQTRDESGRITTQTETTGGATRVFGYTYDLAGRISEIREDGVLTSSYVYDPNGNRLSRTDSAGTINATYDAQDRLVQYGSTAYAHTPNGELRSKTVGGQTTTYQYEGFGHLAGVTLPGGTQVEYLVDGQRRRVGKRVNGTLVQGFLYQDTLRPIAELDGASSVVSRFVYATGDSAPGYMIKNGVTYRIIADQLGSVRLVVNAATGVVAQRLDYDTFGVVTLDTNPGFQPFGFAGGLYDPLTGLVHFGAREYDPQTGRWTTKDPIGFRGGDSNLYGYVLGDPVNAVDPLGLNSLWVALFDPPPLDGAKRVNVRYLGDGLWETIWLLEPPAPPARNWLVRLAARAQVGATCPVEQPDILVPVDMGPANTGTREAGGTWDRFADPNPDIWVNPQGDHMRDIERNR